MKLGVILQSSFHALGPKFHSPCSSFTAELGGCDKRAPCVERGPEFSPKFANCPFAAFQPCTTCPHLPHKYSNIEQILTHTRICQVLANSLHLLFSQVLIKIPALPFTNMFACERQFGMAHVLYCCASKDLQCGSLPSCGWC